MKLNKEYVRCIVVQWIKTFWSDPVSYQFAIENENYEDLASGRVFYNQHGATAFPVRLASELFQRGKAYLTSKGNPGPYRIYDPCCGGGYLLASIGFLHREDIETITASDIDPAAVELASRNLSLLTAAGLQARIGQIRQMHASYGKDSHMAALAGAERLGKLIGEPASPESLECFEADSTEQSDKLNGKQFDIIVSDVPYGNQVEWKTESSDPVGRMLSRLEPLLAPASIVILVSAKDQKISHDRYSKLGQIKIGKRRVTLLESTGSSLNC
jgi:23S rRNA G2445 N2-methylase RlmL